MANQILNVATICTGNICRSPMAEVLLRDVIANDPSLSGRVEVTSAGIARWHVGSPMDPRARAALDRAGLRGPGTLALYADTDYLDQQDVVIVMTREHAYEVEQRLRNPSSDVILWRNLTEPGLSLDVADPYYGDDAAFDTCLQSLRAGGQLLKEVFRQRLDAPTHEA